MRYGVLGPLEVITEAGAVRLGAQKERLVLAALLARANEAVSAGQLVAELWGDDPPRTAGKTLQGYVSRLRRAAPDAAIVTVGAGYRLEADPDDIDALRFARLATDGRAALDAGDPTKAAGLLDEALSLWRGEPFAEFDDASFAIAEASRLNELRLTIVEDRVAAGLALAQGDRMVAELQRLARAHPLRERLWGHLMTALYQAGRQADALATYQMARRHLIEEAGVEPGDELRRIEQAILAHDSSLLRPADAVTSSGIVTVTVLLTDIEGSTRAWEAEPDAMAAAVARHEEIVAEVVTIHGGTVVKTRGEGDATFSVFRRASDAAGAAVALQGAIAKEGWRTARPLRVRVAVHTGEVQARGGDYYGQAVNRAARLRALAQPGQILLSAATAALVADSLEPGTELVDLGPHTLRDLTRPERVHALWATAMGPRPRRGPGQAGVPGPLAALTTTPLVGRDDELGALAAAVQTARDGRLQLALVAGEPGIGKSRVVAEVAARAHDDGAFVLYGRCDEQPLTSYQPFVEMLTAAAPHLAPAAVQRALVDAPELRALVPDLERIGGRDPQQGELLPSDRFRMFSAVAALIRSLPPPVVVVIDDLHWADEPTLQLLRHVTHAATDAPLALLTTFRPTELGRAHPLTDALAHLTQVASARRLDLVGLGLDDVKQLLPGDADERAAEIWRITGGNAFFVVEIGRHLADGHGAEVPVSVKHVVGHRVSRVGEAVNRLLVAAAVVGAEFDLGLAATVAGLDEDETIDAADRAVRAGLLRDAGAHRLAFAHALVRQTLVDELTAPRRIRIHRRVAEAIEAAHPDALDDWAGALAHHWSAAGDQTPGGPAFRYAMQAGDRAAALLAWEECRTHYQRAVEHAEASGDVSGQIVALTELAEVLMLVGEIEESDGLSLRALDLARSIDDADAFARALLAYGTVVRSIDGSEPIMALVEEGLGRLPDEESPLRAQLMARLAFAQLFLGSGGVPLAREAYAMAVRVGDPLALVMAANALRFADVDALDLDAVHAAASELLGTKWALWAVFVRSWDACFAFDRGDVDEAMATWDTVVERTGGLVPLAVGQRTVARGLVAALNGDLDAAETLVHRARTELRFGRANTALLTESVAAAIARLRGHLEATIAPLETLRGFRADLAAPRLALAYAATGRIDDARREIEAMAADGFAAVRQEWAGFYAQGLLARALALVADQAEAAALYDVLAPRAGRLLTLHGFLDCLGSVDHHLGLLAEVTGRPDDAARHLEHALEAHERLGFPTLVAETRAALARVLSASDPARARDLARTALADAERIGMDEVADSARAVLRRLDRPLLAPALISERPLIGRDDEPGRLRSWFDDPGARRLALVTGEPGIGKTRLMGELAAELHAAGVAVLYGTCDEHGALPFQPWLMATRPLEAVPEPEARTSDPELERYRWFDAVERGLAALGRCLVVLDDLHWSDAGTLALLRHLLQSDRAAAVRVVGAYRDTDLDRSRPLSGFVADLWRGDARVRVDLHGLDRGGVAEMLGSDRDAARVHEETEGNPLFVALIAAAPHGDDGLRLPQGIREVLGRRLDRLSADTVMLLRVAALIGREFPLGIAAAAAESSEDAALVAVEEAMAAGMVSEVRGHVDRFAFTHALIARSLADELSTSRRVRLHRRIGEFLAEIPGATSAEVARHLCEAAVTGVGEEAVGWARRAAADALSIGAWEEAARWFEAALDVVDATAGDDSARGLLAVELAEALIVCGDAHGARLHAERGLAVARKLGDSELLARGALAFVGEALRTSVTETAEAMLLEEALAGIGPQPSSLRAKLLAKWAYWDSYVGDRSANVARAEEARAIARRIADDEALMAAMPVVSMLALGDSARVEEAGREAVALAARLGNDAVAAGAHASLCAAALLRGDVATARRRAAAAVEAMRHSKLPRARWPVEMVVSGLFDVLDGHWEAAERGAEEALHAAQGTSTNPFLPLGVYLSQLLPIRWMQGRLAELADTLAWAASTSSGPLLWHSAAAMGLAAAGRHDEARRVLEPIRALSRGAFLESLDSGAMVFHLAASCGPLGERELAAAAYDAIGDRRDPVCLFMVYLFLGVYEHHRGNLAAAAGWPDVAEGHLRAAAEEYEQMGAPAWAARARDDLERLRAGEDQ